MAGQHFDFSAWYSQYLEDLKAKAKQELQKALANTMRDYFALAEDRVKTIFNETVQDFYGSYTPMYYDRNESLYDILETSADDTSLSIGFDPGKMTSFRSGYSGEDGLYDQVFRRGWHGGAGSGEGHPAPGKPYWRTPIPQFYNWGDEAPVAAVSPLEDFKRRLADYEDSQMQSDFNKIWAIHYNNINLEM